MIKVREQQLDRFITRCDLVPDAVLFLRYSLLLRSVAVNGCGILDARYGMQDTRYGMQDKTRDAGWERITIDSVSRIPHPESRIQNPASRILHPVSVASCVTSDNKKTMRRCTGTNSESVRPYQTPGMYAKRPYFHHLFSPSRNFIFSYFCYTYILSK